MSASGAGTSVAREAAEQGYVNARLRGMRSHLSERALFDRLIESGDLQHVIQELSSTTYGADLEAELVHGRDAAHVDEALKDNMVRAYRKVLGFLNESSAELLETLLGRWDVFNIKTILRGSHNACSMEEIKASLVPAGFLSAEDLDGLARIGDVRGVVDTVATWGLPYARALRAAAPEYVRKGNIAGLELALDRHYFEWAASRLEGDRPDVNVVRQVLGTQIDVLNIVTAMRMLKESLGEVDAEPFFLEGGRSITKELYLKLATLSDVDDILDGLKGTPYAGVLEDAALRYLRKGSIAVFERALEEFLTERAIVAGIVDPNGIGVAISYLWAKQNEVTNLRIVIKGIEIGMPPERMREELILV